MKQIKGPSPSQVTRIVASRPAAWSDQENTSYGNAPEQPAGLDLSVLGLIKKGKKRRFGKRR